MNFFCMLEREIKLREKPFFLVCIKTANFRPFFIVHFAIYIKPLLTLPLSWRSLSRVYMNYMAVNQSRKEAKAFICHYLVWCVWEKEGCSISSVLPTENMKKNGQFSIQRFWIIGEVWKRNWVNNGSILCPLKYYHVFSVTQARNHPQYFIHKREGIAKVCSPGLLTCLKKSSLHDIHSHTLSLFLTGYNAV